MNKTEHVIMRCQQRGIHETNIELIKLLGSKQRKPGGVFEYSLRKRDKQKVIKVLKQCIQMLDKVEGKAIVVDSDGTVITAYHRSK